MGGEGGGEVGGDGLSVVFAYPVPEIVVSVDILGSVWLRGCVRETMG